jgi:hypothetical protein
MSEKTFFDLFPLSHSLADEMLSANAPALVMRLCAE